MLDVQIIGDVFDASTNEPRTKENWKEWIHYLYTKHEGREQDEEEVEATAERMLALVKQMPSNVVDAVRRQATQQPKVKANDIVALVELGRQDHEAEMYARGDGMRVWLDAYGIPHDTGKRTATPLW